MAARSGFWILAGFLVSCLCGVALLKISLNSALENMLLFNKLVPGENLYGGLDNDWASNLIHNTKGTNHNHDYHKDKKEVHEGGNHFNKNQGKTWDAHNAYGGDSFVEDDTKKWHRWSQLVQDANKWGGHEDGHNWEDDGKGAKKQGAEWGTHSYKYNDFNKGSFKNYDHKTEYGDENKYHLIEKESDFGQKSTRNDDHFDFKGNEFEKSYKGKDYYKKSNQDGHQTKKKNKTKKKSKGNRDKKGKKSNKNNQGNKKNSGHQTKKHNKGQKFKKKVHG